MAGRSVGAKRQAVEAKANEAEKSKEWLTIKAMCITVYYLIMVGLGIIPAMFAFSCLRLSTGAEGVLFGAWLIHSINWGFCSMFQFYEEVKKFEVEYES